MARFTGLLGLIVFLGLAYAFSTDRRAIRWRTVAWGLGLQIIFAFLVIKWNAGQRILHSISTVITSLLGHSADGSSLVFGRIGTPGDPLATLAFAVLPTIIFVSAFFAVMYHIGVMQKVIRAVAWIMQRTMGTSGAESTNVAASIFMGQTEAPLTIRPFLAGATRSELMVIMTSGMAHVSGGIMAAYISFGINAQDLLSAVIMTAPGTILVAKMLVPETEVPATAGTVNMPREEVHEKDNLIGAIARGTIDGGQLAFNVAIMLISFVALVGLANAIMLGISNFAWTIHMPFTDHGIPFPHSLNAVLGVDRRTHRVAHRHSLARCENHRQPARHPHHDQRVRRLHPARRDEGAALKDAPFRLRRLPFAASPMSAQSACRSAASERSFPTAATISRSSVSAQCLPEPWRTSCPPASSRCSSIK